MRITEISAPTLDKEVHLWRCNEDLRISEVLYTADPENEKLVGADDYEIFPRAQADLLVSAKTLVLQEGNPVRLRLFLTYRNESHLFDLLFRPYTGPENIRGLTCLAIELPQEHIFDDTSILEPMESELISAAPTLEVVIETPAYAQIAGVTLDPSLHGLRGPYGNVLLTPTEWNLLVHLARRQNRVESKRKLLLEVWGPGYEASDSLLHDSISRVRRRFVEAGASRNPIVTAHRVGYLLSAD